MRLVWIVAVIGSLSLSCSPQEQAEIEPEVVAALEVPSVNIVDRLLAYRPVDGPSPSAADQGDALPQFEQAFVIAVGERLVRIGEPFSGQTPFGERSLVAIRTSTGVEAVTLARYIVPNATLGVVTGEAALLFADDTLVAAGNTVLPRGLVVAIHSGRPRSDFVQLTAYDADSDLSYSAQYVRSQDVSQDQNDVRAALLLFLARNTDSPVARRELLQNASDLGVTAFFREVQRELAADRDVERAAQIEPIELSRQVGPAATNVYRGPQRAFDRVVTILSPGTEVTIDARTVITDTVDGRTDLWYRIADPVGWVFGADLVGE